MLDLAAMNAVEGRERFKRSRLPRSVSAKLITNPIKAIIADCGGVSAIHKASAAQVGEADAIKRDAVYKWPTIGIPDRHWPLVMGLSGATADEMLAANVAARETAGASQ